MSKLEDAKIHARAIECVDLPGEQVSLEEFVKCAKNDWNLRGLYDPSSYVCASHNASEEGIRASGQGDVVREFLPRVFDYPHNIVLEIGCGFGRMTRSIAEYATRVWGIDISSSLIELAKKRLADVNYQHITFIEGDGLTLNGIPDGIFDVAFEYIVFQHIPVEEIIINYIREVEKKLKNKGVFIMHGRDIPASLSGTSIGNTWHGCRCGHDLVIRAIENTSFKIVLEEGINTERYWATLQKILA